jgi:hypothetical protein
MRVKCNECGATYSRTQVDGSPYYHECSPEIITHAKFDDAGNLLAAETRTPREHARDENNLPGLFIERGEFVTYARDPNDVTARIRTVHASPMINNGAGFTEIVEEQHQ